MIYILLLFVLVGCLAYWARFKPGYALAYVLFFQSLNNRLFSSLGLVEIKDITTLIAVSLIILFHYKKSVFSFNTSNFLKSKITWGYLLLASYMFFYSVAWGEKDEFSYFLAFFFPGMPLFFMGALLFFNIKMYSDLVKGVIIFSLVQFGIIFSTLGLNLFVIDRVAAGAATGFYAIATGRMAAIGLLFVLILLFKKEINKYWGAAFSLIFLLWLGTTGTRGALVSFSVAVIAFLYTNFSFRAFFRFVFLSLIVTVIAFFLGFFETSIVARTAELGSMEYIESTYRYYRWSLFFTVLPEYYLLGAGPNGWTNYIFIGDVYPHNLIIELVIEYGIVGMVSLLLLIVPGLYTTYYILKSQTTSIYIKLIALAWLFYLTASMFSGDIIGSGFFVYTGLMIGLQKLVTPIQTKTD